MLLQFIVENFRSFHQESILNLVPAKSRIHKDHILKDSESGRPVEALPLAVLYGANASGKSNLIRAISFAQKLVIEGTRSDSPVPTEPFRLATEAADKPSRFEFLFKHEHILYTYGFLTTRTEIKEEWLFAVLKRKEVLLFERITDAGSVKVVFGSTMKTTKDEAKRLQFVAAGTRPNQLFLTEANERNVEVVKPIAHWFRDHLTIIWPDAQYQSLALRAHTDKQFADYLAAFLRVADTGIQNIALVAEKLDMTRHFPDMPEEFQKELLDGLERTSDHTVAVFKSNDFYTLRQDQKKQPELLTLRTEHQIQGGKSVRFNTADESDGTNRIMHMAPALLDLQSSDDVYIIDELDRSLHPLLCRLYVETFLRGVKEKHTRGQMILSTHETCLLDLELLRRDEIWFVEKDQAASSRLTSLAEFDIPVRADLKVARGYLAGRFGAIPFIGDIRRLSKKGATP